MSQLYARVFCQILDSSIAENPHARWIFEDMLKLCNQGILDMTRDAFARRINVPLEDVNRAIAYLEAPDPASRDPDDDGRRIVRMADHRDWGWIIVNWDKYEAIRSKDDQRSQTAARAKRYRDRRKNGAPPLYSPVQTQTQTQTQRGSDARVTLRHASVTATLPKTGIVGVKSKTHWELKQEKDAIEAELKVIQDRGWEDAMSWHPQDDKDRKRKAQLKKQWTVVNELLTGCPAPDPVTMKAA